MDQIRFVLGVAPLVILGCSSGAGGGRAGTAAVHFDVGGFVAYQGEPDVGLPGVAVSLIDSFGETFTAVTGSSGLWRISGVEPGVFTERYELIGYEPVTGSFAVEAFGENDVSNPFVARPPALLQELRLRATVMPFFVGLLDGDDLSDGLGGVDAEYDTSVGDDVTVDVSIPLLGGYLFLEDGVTSDIVAGVLDTTLGTTFTLLGGQIAAMNGGGGLSVDTSQQTRHLLYVSGDAVTPIHGEAVSLLATLRFNAVP